MSKLNWLISTLLTGTLIVFLFGSCSYIERYLSGEDDKGPAELMDKGLNDLDAGRYSDASVAFQDIKDRYPYSKYAITAELKMAEALYRQKEYEQAYEAYDEFERLHPKNQEIPNVIFQKGMCYLEQVKSIDRSQLHTLKAKEEFERLVRKFPRTKHANMGRKKLRKCYLYLAEYELYVGHYYYRMGKYRAAMARFSYIIENYPDLGQYHEAMDYISRCREKLEEVEEL
ncbi:outer membrane protein assembly factor BamD [Thermodesulfobacteriota bacterium]